MFRQVDALIARVERILNRFESPQVENESEIQLHIRTRISKKRLVDGKVTLTDIRYDSETRKAKSFVIAFLEHVESALLGETNSIEDTGNVARTIYAPEDTSGAIGGWLRCDASDDDDVYGIVVGSDATAATNTDPSLNTQISDGAAAGNLEYDGPAWEPTAEVGANVDFEMRRTFTNSSGGNVDVKEIGIYVKTEDTGDTVRVFCIAREVITTVTVADSETLEVVLTLRTTV